MNERLDFDLINRLFFDIAKYVLRVFTEDFDTA